MAHVPRGGWMDVLWEDVKDWVVNDLHEEWSEHGVFRHKYLFKYNKHFFGTDDPTKPKEIPNLRYINRK